MAQTKIEIQVRCNSCDTPLILSEFFSDENGSWAYAEPCSKCSGLSEKFAGVLCRHCGKPLSSHPTKTCVGWL